MWLEHCLNLIVQVLLNIGTFDDCLNNPVNIREFRQIIFDIPDADKLRTTFAIECGGLCLEHFFQTSACNDITILHFACGNDIEQQAGYTDVCQMGCDCCPHDSGSEYSSFANLVGHDNAILSNI